MASKKALCVGINKFQNLPQATLNGCVNDTADMISVLKKYMGFADNDIVKLVDEQATKKNIMTNLTEMVNGAKAGKYTNLVFSISSHGTQVPDQDGDEELDMSDEAFCPTDLIQKGDVWDPDHIITDDELYNLFAQLPETASLECYFDTCHSGTGLKAIDLLLDRKPRLLLPPSLKAFEKVKERSPRSMAVSLKEKGLSTRHILWAACRSDQTSADARIDGTWHGAFTYYLCQNINKSQKNLARKNLLAKVRADLKKNKYDQLPQLETNAAGRTANW
jgi:metacaspase-1